MRPTSGLPLPNEPPTSPILLSVKLLTLAKDADHAGFSETASHLLAIVLSILGEARTLGLGSSRLP